MRWQVASVIPVWVLAAIGAVLVLAVAGPSDRLRWLPVVLAATSIIAFGVQLAIQRKDGFVLRVMASIAGAVVVLGLATAIAPALA